MSAYLEPSSGKNIQDLDENLIRQTVKDVGKNLTHCILHLDGGYFLQTAGDDGSLIFECSEGNGPRNDYTAEEITAFFLKAVHADKSWKKDVFGADWKPSPLKESPQVEARKNTQDIRSSKTSSNIVKDGLKHAMQREVRYGISRSVRRLLRRILRGRF